MLTYISTAIAIWVAWAVARAVYREYSKGPAKERAEQMPVATVTQGRVAEDLGGEWEGSFWEVQEPLSVSAKVRIDYVDGQGVGTSRDVDVRQFGGMGSGSLIIGRCHLRRATRTFRADRIRRCIDLDTGELIPDLVLYLKALHDASPDRLVGRLLADEYDALRVLLYVAKADGQLRAAELHETEIHGRVTTARHSGADVSVQCAEGCEVASSLLFGNGRDASDDFVLEVVNNFMPGCSR